MQGPRRLSVSFFRRGGLKSTENIVERPPLSETVRQGGSRGHRSPIITLVGEHLKGTFPLFVHKRRAILLSKKKSETRVRREKKSHADRKVDSGKRPALWARNKEFFTLEKEGLSGEKPKKDTLEIVEV